MGKALSDASPAAAAVFAAADDALGEPISTLAFEGPEEQLNLTVNSQPAILATSIAYMLRGRGSGWRLASSSRLLRRALHGPVQRDGRGRRHLARRRRAPRPRARQADAGVGRRWRHGGDHRPARRARRRAEPRPVRRWASSRSPIEIRPARSSSAASAPRSKAPPRRRRSWAPNERSSCRSASPHTPR